MKPIRRSRLLRAIRLLLALAPWALLLLDSHGAFARAGGGGGYHGGGGGGGGHGGGGGGFGGGHGGGGGGGGDGSGLVWLAFHLIFSYPRISIPLIVIAVILFLYEKGQTFGPGANPPPRQTALGLGQARAALAALVGRDPTFNEAGFKQRVAIAFTKIQQAWCAQNLAQVRAFISDGVYERFLLQFAEQKAAGWRDQMDGLQINDISLAAVETDGPFDVVAVTITATAVDVRVALATGKRISGDLAPTPFSEVWSFVRRQGTQTVAGRAGLIEGNCPNCGAPIEMNQSANCTNCKALFRSGTYDWVLAEITQASEWDGGRHRGRPGVAQMVERDPGFNAVELEDRASVIFWRKATADRLGKLDPLRKMALPAFGDNYAAALRPTPDGTRWFMGDCAVGSVRLLGVAAAAPLEQAVVEVRWAGTGYVTSRSAPPRAAREHELYRTLFVLVRKAGAATDVGKGISSAHCPTCGAPEPGGTSNACEYCGTVLNDGSQGWVLAELADPAEPRAGEILGQLRS